VQTKIEKIEYQEVNHQLSQANPSSCKGIKSTKLAFPTQVAYKIKPNYHTFTTSKSTPNINRCN
jgi:hypothetical protein